MTRTAFGVGAAALILSTGAIAQAGQAPTAPPNGSLPTGSTMVQAPADSGSGLGSMQSDGSSMASDPATTDRGQSKPHTRHRGAHATAGDSATPPR